MESDWHARGDMAETERLKDWLESQRAVMAFWMDRLIERSDVETLKQVEDHQRYLNRLIGQLS